MLKDRCTVVKCTKKLSNNNFFGSLRNTMKTGIYICKISSKCNVNSSYIQSVPKIYECKCSSVLIIVFVELGFNKSWQ